MSVATLLLHVETRTVGNELAGEDAETWTRTARHEWFKVRTLTASEYVQAQQVQASVSHELRCVFWQGANPRMRLTAGDDGNAPTRTFNVESVVDENDMHRELVWMVKEVV